MDLPCYRMIHIHITVDFEVIDFANSFCMLFSNAARKTLKKRSGAPEKCQKTFKKPSPERFLSVFEGFLAVVENHPKKCFWTVFH